MDKKQFCAIRSEDGGSPAHSAAGRYCRYRPATIAKRKQPTPTITNKTWDDALEGEALLDHFLTANEESAAAALAAFRMLLEKPRPRFHILRSVTLGHYRLRLETLGEQATPILGPLWFS